jgi:5-methyltetrahydrofolate--homocysteine methyltransferase
MSGDGGQMQFGELVQAVIDGNVLRADEVTREALAGGAEAEAVLAEMIHAMEVVGERFSSGEIYVPEMLVSARAMKVCLGVLQPSLVQGQHESRGSVVIGTVQGDVHDVGKNIVALMLEGAGFDVHDLGVDVSPQVFVQAVEEHAPNIVGISALLTTTMPVMKDVIEALTTAGLRDKIIVLVGGAPVTDAFADQVGADAYASDAAAASETAKQLVASAAASREV